MSISSLVHRIQNKIAREMKTRAYKEIVYSPLVHPVSYSLEYQTATSEGNILGARGSYLDTSGELCRLCMDQEEPETLYVFEDPIVAIHAPAPNVVFVATDTDWWNPESPSKIYVSNNDAKDFSLVRSFYGPSILWWSIDSSKDGTVFIGEYGPKTKGTSNRVWKTDLSGTSWEIVFEAPEKHGVHIHRVAVDPFTHRLWVTYGDDEKGICYRDDHGDWQKVAPLQATALAFTDDAVFFGDDYQIGRIYRYERATQECTEIFNSTTCGILSGGSVYDMGVTPSGSVLACFKKYPEQTHPATVWGMRDGTWHCLIRRPSKRHEQSGSVSIAGPDSQGYLHCHGYKIEDF